MYANDDRFCLYFSNIDAIQRSNHIKVVEFKETEKKTQKINCIKVTSSYTVESQRYIVE